MSTVKITGTVHNTAKLVNNEQLIVTATGYVDALGIGAAGILIPAGITGATAAVAGRVSGGAGKAGANNGPGGIGVDILAAANVTNAGTIIGGAGGYAHYGTGAAGGAGVAIMAAATVTNAGTIIGGAGGSGDYGGTGGAGVYLDGGTLTTSGTIVAGMPGLGPISNGSSGDAVEFGAAAATLVVEAGAVFDGVVAANSSVDDVLVLGSDGGTLTGQFNNFTNITEAAGITWTLAGFNASSTLTIDGTVDENTYFNFGGTLINNGLLVGAYYVHGNGGAGISISGGPLTSNNGTILGGLGGNALSTGTYSGGAGVDLGQGSFTNNGTILGGYGKERYASTGGTGGDGVAATGGSLVNDSRIVGGKGAYARGSYGADRSGTGGAGGAGIYLRGATVTNDALVSGGVGGNAYYGTGGSGGVGARLADSSFAGTALTNAGTILGGAGGVGSFRGAGGAGGAGAIINAGVLSNLGSVEGGNGAAGFLGEFDDYGGTGGDGVDLGIATLINEASVVGGAGGYGVGTPHFNLPTGYGGTGVNLSGGTLINNGTITGGAGGGAINDGLNGGVGVLLDGGIVITSGTIAGGAGGVGKTGDGAAGYAVKFGSAAGVLVVDAGASFDGIVAANSRVNDVLQLDGSGGTLAGLGSAFTGFTTISESAGATWTLAGTNTLGPGTSLVVAGTLTPTGTLSDAGAVSIAATGLLQSHGTLSFLGPVGNSGTIDATSGTASFASDVTGTGTLDIGSTGTLALMAGTSAGQTLDFAAAGGLLDLGVPIDFAGAISGFAAGDTIDLLNTAFDGRSYINGVLTIKDGSQTVAALHFDGSYTKSDFSLKPDQHGGTWIKFV